MKDPNNIAPLQLIVIGFEKPRLTGRIMRELNRLREQKLIRLVDALAVQKRADGSLEYLQVSDLPKGEAAQYGAVIGYFIGLGAGGEKTAEDMAMAAALRAEDQYEYGLRPDQIETIAEDIPVGGAAVLLLVEHLWALPFRQAAREAGGILIAQDFLSPEALIGLGQEALQAIV